MKYDDIKLGQRVQIIQNPDNFNHVIEQFEGRIGTVIGKQSIKRNGGEKRIHVTFGIKWDGLISVSQTGEFNNYKLIPDYYLWWAN